MGEVVTFWLVIAGSFLIPFLIGSLPFGYLLARFAGLGDIRHIGSGNIGATNVLRTGHKGLAAATLLLDLGKGLAAVILVRDIYDGSDLAAAIAAFGAVLGHCFTPWLLFRGGKGVATGAGVAIALAWPIGLTYALAWLGMLAITRISSLAGMSAPIAATVAAFALGHPDYGWGLAAISVVVMIKHRDNIARLRAGNEPKVGHKG